MSRKTDPILLWVNHSYIINDTHRFDTAESVQLCLVVIL